MLIQIVLFSMLGLYTVALMHLGLKVKRKRTSIRYVFAIFGFMMCFVVPVLIMPKIFELAQTDVELSGEIDYRKLVLVCIWGGFILAYALIYKPHRSA